MCVTTSSEPVLFRIVSLSFPPGAEIAYCSIVSRRIYRPCFLVPQRSEKADGLGKPYDSRLETELTARCRRVRRLRNGKRGMVKMWRNTASCLS